MGRAVLKVRGSSLGLRELSLGQEQRAHAVDRAQRVRVLVPENAAADRERLLLRCACSVQCTDFDQRLRQCLQQARPHQRLIAVPEACAIFVICICR